MKKIYYLLKTLLFLTFLTLFFPVSITHAEVHTIPELTNAINNITDTIVWIIGSLLVLIIISFGIQFILHAENPQERNHLRTKIIWALIGLFIILTARPISAWIQTII